MGVVLCVYMHSGVSQKEDLISVSCGPNCTSIVHGCANLASVFGMGWISRLLGKGINPLSTSLLPHGPLFLIMSCGIYCCQVFLTVQILQSVFFNLHFCVP